MTEPSSSPNTAVPLISVGMPVYNGEDYLAASVQCVLDQTEGDFELIIADNASSDGTEAICRDFASRDARIRYVRNTSNIGAAGNYNKLLDLARAEFFRWSNADDLLEPTLHERCLAALRAHPEAVLAYGKTVIIDGDDNKLRDYDDNLAIDDATPSARFSRYFEQVGLTNAIYGLMRTAAVRRTHVFGDGSLPAADTAFMAELILHGGFVEVDEPLFYRRMHEAASSHDRADDSRQTAFWSASQSKFRLPVIRQHMKYLRRAWRTDADAGEKIRLTGYILRRLNWHRNEVASELVGALRRGSK
ncbi:MAG: glycosyltransferase [Pseudomonadota bacterium]